MNFDIKAALAATRKAYNDKTLQMFLPPDKLPPKIGSGNGCAYLHVVDGVCYHCAVGAMFVDMDEKFASDEDLNYLTDAYDLFQTLEVDNLDEAVANQFAKECIDLQFYHDAVVKNKRLLSPDCADTERKIHQFEELLSRLEAKYVG